MTGVSDVIPYYQQLELLKRIAPDVKIIGMVFNPGESNAVFGIEQSKIAAEKLGFEITTAPAHSTNEVQQAFRSLARDVDAFYTGSDNTVASAIAAAVKIANENMLPFLCGDVGTTEAGGLVTLGINYVNVGQETADLVLQVSMGESAKNLPVVTATGTELVVNLKTAELIGIEIPEDILQNATRTIE